jgi:hypothetical protein
MSSPWAFRLSGYPSASIRKPSSLTLTAAFQSLSCWVAHLGLVHALSDNGRSSLWYPHAERRLVEAKYRLTLTKCLCSTVPCMPPGRGSSPKEASCHDFACLVFASDFKARSSKQIASHEETIRRWDNWRRKSCRRLAIRSCTCATFNRTAATLLAGAQVDARPRNLTLNDSAVDLGSTNHRFGLTRDHDSSMRTSAPAGCDSAQQRSLSSLHRPGAPAGCSRC